MTASDLALPVAVHAGLPGAPAVLIFVGNYGARGPFGPLFEPLAGASFTVVFVPYPGAKGLPSPKTEARFKADALAVPELVPEAGSVHVLSHSLGSGLALHVAAHRPVASVFLEAHFARLCDVMTRRSWAPACLIPWVPRWDSLALVPDIFAPVFIVQGIPDAVIPSSESLRLAEALIANGNVVTTRFDGQADHWTVSSLSGLQEEMNAWIAGGSAEAKGQSREEARVGFAQAGGRS